MPTTTIIGTVNGTVHKDHDGENSWYRYPGGFNVWICAICGETRPPMLPSTRLEVCCWECKTCGHEHWSRSDVMVPGRCPGCNKEQPTWIGHKEGINSSLDPSLRR